MELTEIEAEEIAQMLKDGFTSGRISNHTDTGEAIVFVAWNLKFEKWAED